MCILKNLIDICSYKQLQNERKAARMYILEQIVNEWD